MVVSNRYTFLLSKLVSGILRLNLHAVTIQYMFFCVLFTYFFGLAGKKTCFSTNLPLLQNSSLLKNSSFENVILANRHKSCVFFISIAESIADSKMNNIINVKKYPILDKEENKNPDYENLVSDTRKKYLENGN